MKVGIHLTVDKKLYDYLKRNRVNASKYVEKLILQDLAAKASNISKDTHKSSWFESPPGAILVSCAAPVYLTLD